MQISCIPESRVQPPALNNCSIKHCRWGRHVACECILQIYLLCECSRGQMTSATHCMPAQEMCVLASARWVRAMMRRGQSIEIKVTSCTNVETYYCCFEIVVS
ncbi:hypothetical protein MTO96_011249 [Rhipicephalus appendiculatus]